jgi:hypothetical protein
MDRKYKFGALAIVAVLPLLIAAQGGFPSRPTFQRVTVGTNGAVLTNTGTSLQVNGAVIYPDIVCTTACNVTTMQVGQIARILKTSSTQRQSTVTMAFDPDLQFTVTSGMSFAYDFCLAVSTTTGGGVAGFKYEWGQLTAGSGSGGFGAYGNVNSASYTNGGFADITYSIATILESTNMICGHGLAKTNNASWGLMWAQQVSTAVNTTILGNNQTTYLTVRRIG